MRPRAAQPNFSQKARFLYGLFFSLCLLLPSAGPTWAQKQQTKRIEPRFKPLVARLDRAGFPRKWLRELFARGTYDAAFMGKKLRVLYRSRYNIPAPSKPRRTKKQRWKYLYEPHLTPAVRARLRHFNKAHAGTLRKAAKTYKVQKEVILALLVVETKLGHFLGHQDALSVLASMAASKKYTDIASFFTAHPAKRAQIPWIERTMRKKADWAFGQLKALLRFCRKNKLDPTNMPSSIYGAIGICQFMPSSALAFGKDGDNDGVVDLYDPCDAVASVAYYMRKAGWKNSHSRKRKIKVLRRYNNDSFYARTVLSVAGQLSSGG